jgi:hypothetical protein
MFLCRHLNWPCLLGYDTTQGYWQVTTFREKKTVWPSSRDLASVKWECGQVIRKEDGDADAEVTYSSTKLVSRQELSMVSSNSEYHGFKADRLENTSNFMPDSLNTKV